MKALFISSNEESGQAIKKLMYYHFPKIQLEEVAPYAQADLLDLITLNGPFSFILIDCDKRTQNIDEIYTKILATLGVRPFVFMGAKDALKLNISEEIIQLSETNFLIEMIKDEINLENFQSAINHSIAWVKEEEFEESILEFSKNDLQPIRLRNFYLFDQMPYDIYLELTSNKFGKLLSKNKPYSHRLIQAYARKNIKHLYLKKDEHLMFLDTSIKSLLKVYEDKSSPRNKNMELHLKTIFFVHQFIRVASASADVINLVQHFIESCHELIKSKENMIELINQLSEKNLNMTFAEHSLATAYVCESILSYMTWSSHRTRGRLLLAAILQNIGLSNDEMIKIHSLSDPCYKLLSAEDQLEIKNHCIKAAQMSAFFNGFSDVDFILGEHHEHPTGDGFPNQLNSSNLTTISCIFIIANNFVTRLAISNQNRAAGSYEEIIKYIRQTYYLGNFKEPIKALEKIFITLNSPKSQ